MGPPVVCLRVLVAAVGDQSFVRFSASERKRRIPWSRAAVCLFAHSMISAYNPSICSMITGKSLIRAYLVPYFILR